MANYLDELKARAFKIIELLEVATKNLKPTLTSFIIEKYGRNPFHILISCLLSLRARDSSTILISQKLFNKIQNVNDILAIPEKELENIIYPVNYYKNKARIIKSVCKELALRFNYKVPDTQQELLSIKFIGRKTTALVLSQAFGIPAICVDVHVHRISNRLGLVSTRTPLETEKELKKIFPKKKWLSLNSLFVTWGQNVCVPISPFCSKCVLLPLCPQIGVTKHR